VKALNTPPHRTITAPDKPDALPESSFLTCITAALALGVESPFPIPTKIVPPKMMKQASNLYFFD
jgi:hypothetical protein